MWVLAPESRNFLLTMTRQVYSLSCQRTELVTNNVLGVAIRQCQPFQRLCFVLFYPMSTSVVKSDVQTKHRNKARNLTDSQIASDSPWKDGVHGYLAYSSLLSLKITAQIASTPHTSWLCRWCTIDSSIEKFCTDDENIVDEIFIMTFLIFYTVEHCVDGHPRKV